MDRVGALRAVYKARDAAQGIALYRDMLQSGPVSPEVHLFGSRLYRLDGDLWGAMRALDHAKAGGPTGTILGQVLFTRGYLFREMGAPREAIEQLEECRDRFPEYADLGSELLGPLWYNMSLAMRQAQRYAEALAAYQKAADHFREAGMQTYLCMCLHNLAWVCCMNGSLIDAQDALAEAKPLCSTVELCQHQTLGEAYLAAVAPDRNPVHVMERCIALLDQEDHLPAEVASHACWLAGKVALEMDLLDKALVMADLAVHHAARSRGESRCLQDASDLRRDVLIASGLLRKSTGS